MENFNALIAAVLGKNVFKATKYLSPNRIIRATRRRYGHRLITGRTRTEITLTIGQPNYIEREFIKKCKQAGEPFPVKKIQLKIQNPKRLKLKKRI